MAKKKFKSSFSGRIKSNAEQRKKGFSYGYLTIPMGVDLFQPETDSRVVFDIMPYEVTDKNHMDVPQAEVGELWYKKPFKIHREVGATKKTVICPTTFGKPCPICEYATELRKREHSDEEIRALRPSKRNLYAVIVRSGKGKNDKVQLFEMSDFLFQKTFEEQLSEETEFDVFPDHQEGFSIRVRFAEDSLGGNKYASPTRFDFVERNEQYDDSILDKIPKLDELLEVLSYNQIKAMFFEMDDDIEEAEHEEVEKKPVRKTSRAKAKPKRKKEITIESLSEMSFEELEDLCDEKNLNIDPFDYEEDELEELTMDIAEELGLVDDENESPFIDDNEEDTEDDDDEEDDDEPEEPKRKPVRTKRTTRK